MDGVGWGVFARSFVSVIALRLVLVSFLRETVTGFFCSSGWASDPCVTFTSCGGE